MLEVHDMWFEDEEGELRPALLSGAIGAEAFILGAGFSRAIGESMPLMTDLIDPLDNFLSTRRGTGLATFPRLENVELFLSSLAIAQPFLDEPSNLHNRALFVEIAEWLARHVFEAQREALVRPLPSWLAALVRTWHRRRSTVVTLNYDTLVESAVMSLEDLDPPTEGRVMPQFTYASPVRFAASEWAGTPNPYQGRKETFTLCKLHGSLGWWRTGSAQLLDLEVWKDTFGADTSAPWNDIAGRVMTGEPLLVPPTLTKSDYFDNDQIRANWRRARTGLSSATTIVIMGYSLPAGDTQTAALLGSATRGQQILVVDLHPGEIVRRVSEAALPRAGEVRSYNETDQPIVAWSESWAAEPDALYGAPPTANL